MTTNPLAKYIPSNDYVRDLIAVSLGVGFLKLAGKRFEVARLPFKSLALGAGITFGTYETIRLLEQKDTQNRHMYLALLVIFVAGSSTITKYFRTGNYLPSVIKFEIKQIFVLHGTLVASMLIFDYLGSNRFSSKPTKMEIELEAERQD